MDEKPFQTTSLYQALVNERVRKLMARISRIGDELKLISLTRSRISAAVRGGSSRSSGLMWTMTMSLLSQP